MFENSHNWFTFKGRIGRRSLWLNLAVMYGFWLLVALPLHAFYNYILFDLGWPHWVNHAVDRDFAHIFFLGWYASHITYVVRRFNDLGMKRKFFWLLLACDLVTYLAVCGILSLLSKPVLIAMCLPQVYAFYLRYYLYTRPGQKGANAFGAHPKKRRR